MNEPEMRDTSSRQIILLFGKVLLVLFLVFVVDRITGSAFRKYYFRQESGAGYRTTYSIDSTIAEILVFGSSRASHSYVPDIFEDSLGLSFYNTGRDGNHVLYNYALFKAITKRYLPKIMIMDIRPEDLCTHTVEYERLSLLLPYYRTHPEIAPIIDLRGPFEKIRQLSAIYPFNSLMFQIAAGNLSFNKERYPDIKGYVPIMKTMEDEPIDSLELENCITDENKLSAVKDIISTCRRNNIELVLVFSPSRSYIPDNYLYRRITLICSENGVRFLDLSNDPVFMNDHTLFANREHLNDDGARIFSAIVANKIRRGE